MDRFLSFEQFVEYLERHKVPHKTDHATRVIELTVNAPPLPGNIFVKWEPSIPIFTFIQFMIENVPVDRIPDLETAIVRLNTVMEIGGFSFDYQRNRVFCRFTVPVFPPDGITAAAFQQTFKLVVFNARGFAPLFHKVIAGAKGADIEEIAKEYAAQLKAAPET